MKRFKHALLVVLVFAAVISFSACKNAIPSLPEELPTGTITGKAVYQNTAESSGITKTLEKTDGLRSMSVIRSIKRKRKFNLRIRYILCKLNIEN